MASAKNKQPAVGEDETEVILFPAMKPQDEPSKESSTMPGNIIDEDSDSDFASTNGVRTLLLVGRRGYGKSATGNSILMDEKFKSSFGGVTNTCELQTTVLENGLTLNVIDTPGFSGFSSKLGKDIARCIDMAKHGIHAVLVVLSATAPFRIEELAAIVSLQNFFGHRIYDYMVIVFTGGDELEENGETLDDVFGRGCPKPLREILEKCKNRKVLFDNKSKDKVKRAEQLNELLFLVDEVVNINGGKTFADEIFAELKTREENLLDQSIEVDSLQGNSTQVVDSHKELIKCYRKIMVQINNMVKEKLKETILRLGLQLTEEREARSRVSRVVHLRSLGCDYFLFSTGILSKCYSGSKELKMASALSHKS